MRMYMYVNIMDVYMYRVFTVCVLYNTKCSYQLGHLNHRWLVAYCSAHLPVAIVQVCNAVGHFVVSCFLSLCPLSLLLTSLLPPSLLLLQRSSLVT